ncbi:MAG: hypothetical protein ACRBDI_04570 [Alphaproteobacteria bacterium]
MIENKAAFNNVSSGGFGYGRSVHHSPKDIMSASAPSPSPSIENLFNTQSASLASASNAPLYDQPDEAPTETLMEKLHPETNYQGPDFKKQDNMRNVNMVVKDGEKIAQRTDFAKQENDEQKETLKQDFKTDKAEAVACLKEAAVNNDCDPGAAVDTLVSTGGAATKVEAAGAILVGGAGSLATMGAGAAVIATVSKEDQKLSPEKQKAVLEDTLKQLQTRSASNEDTRMSASMSGGGASGAPMPDEKSDAHWENFDARDLEEFLATDVEDLPEMEALCKIECDIEEAQENQRYVAAHYGETGDLVAKAEAAASGGHSRVLEAELQNATVAVDAAAVEITGMGLQGIVAMKLPDGAANDAKFDNVSDIGARIVEVSASETETRYDYTLMNQQVIGDELGGFMQKQMQAAFG